MNTTLKYTDEASIDPELICSICHSPFIDPCCTPCGETFCRQCIMHWIQTQNGSCPHCREPLSADDLTQSNRVVRSMLDRLQVKCIACGQTELQRGNFDDHIQKICPKSVVTCPSADIKCSWTGQRDQLNQHLVDCRFESMRPVISQFIVENQQLNDQMNQQTTQITEQQNEIRQLKEQLEQLKTQVNTSQHENQQLKEQLRQKNTEITHMSSELHICGRKKQQDTVKEISQAQLDCGGRAWYDIYVSLSYYRSGGNRMHEDTACRINSLRYDHICLYEDNKV